MSWEALLQKLGNLTASADCSAHQYNFVKLSAAGTVTFCAAATDRPLGVLQNKPLSGQAAEIAVFGVTKMVAGAAVTAGVTLMSDSAGRAITATGSGALVMGIALETATAANQIIAVLIPGAAHAIP